jgi:glutamate--cysteine ligase
MMKATASTQVAFDYSDEADAGRKLRVAVRLGPAVNALFANAPLYAGNPTGFASFRGHVWHGMDEDRSGLLVDLLRGAWSFERYVEFALDVPMLFVAEGDHLLPPPGMTFREFLKRGHDGRLPNLHDFELHLSTIFTEVRLKRFLEVRGADATPAPLALAVPAIWKGLLYDSNALAAAEEIAERFDAEKLCAFSELVAKHGLEAEFDGVPLVAVCRKLVRVAEVGLRAMGEDVAFLAPLRDVLESGRSPAARWPTNGIVADVLAATEC